MEVGEAPVKLSMEREPPLPPGERVINLLILDNERSNSMILSHQGNGSIWQRQYSTGAMIGLSGAWRVCRPRMSNPLLDACTIAWLNTFVQKWTIVNSDIGSGSHLSNQTSIVLQL
jgi:hypothetical protein